MKKNNITINFISILLVISSIVYLISCLFFSNSLNYMETIVNSLPLILFTLLFVLIAITSNRRKNGIVLLSSLILFFYYGLIIMETLGIVSIPNYKQVEDFSNKSLTYVVDWAARNNIELEQVYEYSDLVSEYHVISQDIKAGTKVKKVKSITLAVSDGSNPYKEIIIPNMVGWSSDDVIKYIEENHLTNVKCEFVSSEKAVDTLIEQSKSGTIKRNDEIQFTFSYGEEIGYEEVKLIDFTNMSKFKVEFYLKQHHLRYEFSEDYSNKIKQGNAMKQELAPGTMVKIDDTKVKVVISKGKKIKVPDLTSMSTKDVTAWIIKNKLKLSLTDKYDDNVKEDKVISSNYKKGDVISRGTTVEIVISRGQLKMKDFDNLSDFLEWASKYNIKYEQTSEFSDSVEAGSIIRFSHKKGQVIKNDDTVIVTISDGAKKSVPDLTNLSKGEITSKLDKLALNYNFVYKSSDSVAEGKAIKQSISAGSEVSSGTTITITLSSGKEKESAPKKRIETNSNSNNNSNSEQKTENKCEEKSYTVSRKLLNVFNNYSGYNTVKSQIESFFASEYPGVNIKIVAVDGGDATSGSYIGGIGPGDTVKTCGPTYEIKLAK